MGSLGCLAALAKNSNSLLSITATTASFSAAKGWLDKPKSQSVVGGAGDDDGLGRTDTHIEGVGWEVVVVTVVHVPVPLRRNWSKFGICREQRGTLTAARR